jgi:hypothetical protein
VCLKDNEVNHRFVYFEEWIQINGKDETLFENETPTPTDTNNNNEKYLKQCYFGRFMCDGLNARIHK